MINFSFFSNLSKKKSKTPKSYGGVNGRSKDVVGVLTVDGCSEGREGSSTLYVCKREVAEVRVGYRH
ncbi:hypothetical protein KPL47_09855 [Clostridium estertheticum]|uniref:hypothetical protein n=1 Tax=Clostridium estertheticum TaxID=238834 RepID=UPI001C0CC873|nr:hypothetical protein [Clostridium estertheticum]MBU3176676.1 hypothetical protein [Clostridium estertheticum]